MAALLLSGAAVGAALALAVLAEVIHRRRRAAPPLDAGERGGEAVTALLPVRDEERNVEACLAGLLAQPGLRVRVIDDGSADATRALAEAVARSEPRVEVLAAPAPPPGWGGKLNALVPPVFALLDALLGDWRCAAAGDLAAKDGKVVCFFQSAQKFKTRYSTFGFSDKANLDEGAMWPTSFALKALTVADQARIGALVKKAVS